MRETRILEFKETITNTFLKTVSAFSNYDGGTILFGVDDDGNVKGLPDVKQACLDIENKINDSISPQFYKIVLPLFEKDANLTEDEKVIYKLLSKTMLKPISEIAPYVSFGKSKTTKLLKDMGEKGVIAIEGKGRGTKYIIK